MHINIDKILQERNLTRYWLAKEIDCNYQSLTHLCNNTSKLISFDLLERICNVLNVTPTDILIVDKNNNKE